MELVSEAVAATLGIDPKRGVTARGAKMAGAPAPTPMPAGRPDWVQQAAPAHDDTARAPAARAQEPLVELPCPICEGPLLVAPSDHDGVCPHCETELEFEVVRGPAEPTAAPAAASGAVTFDPRSPITTHDAPLIEVGSSPGVDPVPGPQDDVPAAPVAAAQAAPADERGAAEGRSRRRPAGQTADKRTVKKRTVKRTSEQKTAAKKTAAKKNPANKAGAKKRGEAVKRHGA